MFFLMGVKSVKSWEDYGVLIEKGHVRNKFFSQGGRNVSCLHLGWSNEKMQTH